MGGSRLRVHHLLPQPVKELDGLARAGGQPLVVLEEVDDLGERHVDVELAARWEQSGVIRSHQEPSGATRTHREPPRAIGSYREPSGAIRSHQGRWGGGGTAGRRAAR